MLEFKEELKALLSKYKASIYIITDGEGYSQTQWLEVETENNQVEEFGDEISVYNL